MARKEKQNSTKDTEKKKRFSSIIVDGEKYKSYLPPKFENMDRSYTRDNPKQLKAFIPGTIKEVFVKTGQKVEEGQDLLILDAMKMDNTIKAPQEGTIKKLMVQTGSKVMKNELLIEFK